MSHFKSIAVSGLAAATVLVSMSSANATVMTQTQTVTFATALTDWTNPQNFNLFNTNLGTLTAVNVTATLAGSATLTIKNTGASTATVSGYGTGAVFLDSGNTAIDNVFLNYLFTLTKNVRTGVVTGVATTSAPANGMLYLASASLAPNASTSTVTTLNQVESTDIASGDLAAFGATGGGTTTLIGSTAGTFGSNGGTSNAQVSLSQTMGETVVITYTYSPPPVVGTPEPASMAMLGMGLVGLGAAARRKRRV